MRGSFDEGAAEASVEDGDGGYGEEEEAAERDCPRCVSYTMLLRSGAEGFAAGGDAEEGHT